MTVLDSPKTTPGFSPADVFARLSPLGLAMSSERVLVWVNDSFATMFGFRTEELVGQSFALLFPTASEFDRIGQRMLAAMSGCGIYQDERLMRCRNGHLRRFRVHGHATHIDAPFREAAWVFEPLVSGGEPETLTPREREVLVALAAGQTAKECAKLLCLSPRTVEKLRARLRQRYGVRNAAGLIGRVMG